MLNSISVARIKSVSSHSGASPLMEPNTMAIKVEITVERIPIVMDILPPYHIIEKISLPSVSVPKRNSLQGLRL